ncbi:unnamed protein product [Coffea canephora]|uniref:Homeobox domain-containing protein n=1 Tax=Coffea canephora TaxID=49390 RepID=A0A068U4N4_COFCA|nr:unnamed protein product [Coffea canephora]
MELQLANENQLELVVSNSPTSLQDLLDSQTDLFRGQIDELENIVLTQCQLTGVNPLSQEMAAGALSIKIGKRPRDLLNPKAIKYMQSIFSVKDAITKKETREISALYGVTATQVREFFTVQRARVRKFVRLSREKSNRSSSCKEVLDGIPQGCDPNEPLTPVPLDSVGPTSTEEGPTSLTQNEVLPSADQSDKYFLDNIFSLMRKEESFSGQVKLMEWILQIQNSSVLYWFLNNGGVMILATWLTQAALEEQTSVLRVILKVLCHLPLQKALPVHMSAILQSVNSLRFYRISDVSNRARVLLSRWSKAFARSQALRKSNGTKSAIDAQDEMLLKQSIHEVMGNESWDSKIDVLEDNSTLMDESLGNFRKLESQPAKLLTASADDQNRKLIRGALASQNRERRKVLLVEQPGQKSAGRTTQTARSTTAPQGRPLSADDIQKAKMRAQFMQSKYGKTNSISDASPQMQLEGANKSALSNTSILVPPSKAHTGTKIEETNKSGCSPVGVANPEDASVDKQNNCHSEEPPWKKCKRFQIPWQIPPEIGISVSWRVGAGENSKEVEVQKKRIHRERETVYKTFQEIPSDPKEPWDQEIDYDDSLTAEIPIEQLPDGEFAGASVSPRENERTAGTSGNSSSLIAGGSMPEPDLELLAALLKNPELVFALTSGQAGNLSNEETIKLLDMIKANEMNSLANITASSGKSKPEEKVEVSLPSPTPSSDPVTSARKPDYAKNPFSQQKTTLTNEILGIPGTAAIRSQESVPASNVVQSHNLPTGAMVAEPSTTFPQLAQHAIPHALLSEEKLRASGLVQPQVLPATVLAPQQAATVQQLAQQMAPQVLGSHEQRLLPLTSSLHHNIPAYASNAQLKSSSELLLNMNNTSLSRSPPLTNSMNGVAPAMVVNPSSMSLVGSPLRPQTQMQPSYAPEAPLAHSWRPRPGLDPISRQNNVTPDEYEAFVGASARAPVARSSWEKNDLMVGPDFESWSPENSPTRSHGYVPGWNVQEPMVNPGQSYRPERPIYRHAGYPPSSGYHDPGISGTKRWRDRRR